MPSIKSNPLAAMSRASNVPITSKPAFVAKAFHIATSGLPWSQKNGVRTALRLFDPAVWDDKHIMPNVLLW